MVRPGSRECWRDEDAVIVQGHVESLAALLKLSNLDRGMHPDPLVLRETIMRTAPLLDAGSGVIGTLSLPPHLFVGVVEALDRQQEKKCKARSPIESLRFFNSVRRSSDDAC